MCQNEIWSLIITEDCPKVCGFCEASGITHDCGSHTHCPIWIRNNFCNNTYYTLQQRQRYCGKLCRLC
ncbi:shTK domain protein [Oesophagostomum dentatum]|uniref:ShTK domain protein n=1 Tax=Oesophagostomum dentatum TaxID=61180 RepID=A0A0B1S6N3_OESDE|nr:shTK domain protein [Oesophagostomum dentatum]